MLQPRGRLRGAGLRFDALAAINRPGARQRAAAPPGAARALPRRRAAALGLDPARAARAVRRSPGVVALPFPVAPRPSAWRGARPGRASATRATRTRRGSTWSPQAWRLAAPEGRRLVVTGIDPDAGRAFLRSRGVAEPAGRRVGRDPRSGADHGAADRRAEAYMSASRYRGLRDRAARGAAARHAARHDAVGGAVRGAPAGAPSWSPASWPGSGRRRRWQAPAGRARDAGRRARRLPRARAGAGRSLLAR